MFLRLNSFLRDNTIVISDVGDALFGAVDLNIHHDTQFLGTAYYASMGFAVPGGRLGRSWPFPNAVRLFSWAMVLFR